MPTIYLPDVSITLVAETCCVCGIAFGIPSDTRKHRLDDHGYFYCPNGHSQHYTGKTEAEKLREQLASKDREIAAQKSRVTYWSDQHSAVAAQKSAVERSLRATKAVVTRTKKKIVAGRCPCCSTKFKDLAVHMRTEHPNYDPEKAAAAIEAKVSSSPAAR